MFVIYCRRMIEAHLENSNRRVKINADVAAGKGSGAEERLFACGRFWQFGEYPLCCRSDAESYLILGDNGRC